MNKELRLIEIENQIKKAESERTTGTIMIIVSLFVLWPLLIIGIVMYFSANKKIQELNDEKKRIMFEDYFNANNK